METYIAEEIEPSLEKVDRGCLEIASLYHVPMPSQGLMLERGVRKRTLIALHRKGLLDRLHPDRYVLHDSLRSYFSGSIPAHRLEEIVPKVVERLLGEARRQADRGSPGEAIPFLGNAVEIDDDPKRLFTSLELLARVRRFAGDFDGAIEALRTALGIAPKLQAEARPSCMGRLPGVCF